MSEEHRVPPLAASCHELLSSRASWRKGALSRYAQSVRRSNHSVNIDQNTTRLGSGTQDNGLVFQEHLQETMDFSNQNFGAKPGSFPFNQPIDHDNSDVLKVRQVCRQSPTSQKTEHVPLRGRGMARQTSTVWIHTHSEK
jgi:hypothetical protein